MKRNEVVITERIFHWIPIPAHVVWGLLISILLSIHLIWTGSKQTESHIITSLAVGLLTFIAIYTQSYVYIKIQNLKPTFSILLDIPKNRIDDWIKKNFIDTIFNTKYNLLTGFLFPIFLLPGIFIGNWFNQYNQDFAVKIFDASIGMVSAFFCSMAIFMYFPILKGFSQLKHQPINNISIFRLREFAHPISLTFTKFALFVSFAYSIMLIIVIFGPIAIGAPFYFYAITGILITIATFVLPQIELRKVIRKAKGQILEQVRKEIQKSMTNLSKQNDSESAKRVDILLDLHNKLDNLSETSLSWDAIFRLLGSIVLPVLITIIEQYTHP